MKMSPSRDATMGRVLLENSREDGEPSWLEKWRKSAREIYNDAGLPNRSTHLWRYTDPARFLPPAVSISSESDSGMRDSANSALTERIWAEELAPNLDEENLAAAILTSNGQPRRIKILPGASRSGVSLLGMQEAISRVPEMCERVLGRLVGPEHGKYEALNAWLFQGGVFLHVPQGVVVEKPVHILDVATQPGILATRLAVIVEDGASVTVIDERMSGVTSGPARLYNVSEIILGSDAKMHLVTVQRLNSDATTFMTQRALLGRGAHFTPVLASFGGALTKVDTGTLLHGAGSETEMTGFLSATNRQKFDHHTVHFHEGEHTRSNLDFKTVLNGRSQSAYTGLIRIEPTARYSEAYQENRNLLLSQNCRAESIPELEILTEEVQCKHGATVGPLDEGQLFFLMSRCIPKDEAIRIIVEGHFESALRRLPVSLQSKLRDLLARRLKES